MRVLTALVALIAVSWVGVAHAEMNLYERTLEYKVVEPCNIMVTEGTVTLGWDPCGGDVEVVTVEYEDYPHPLVLMFYTGCPDFCEIPAPMHTMGSFCCHECSCCMPDVYCMDCNPCCWYCYETELCYCGDLICVKAWLPSCMALCILDVY